MGEQSTLLVSQAVGYIEENLDHKLGLDQVAEVLFTPDIQKNSRFDPSCIHPEKKADRGGETPGFFRDADPGYRSSLRIRKPAGIYRNF